MNQNISRRQFLLATGVAASASLVSSPLSWLNRADASEHVVRRDVGNMSAHDPTLESYQKAIKAMKALPERDTHSWTYQAAIYSTVATKTRAAWNTCQHGNYFFWSWHRMYLYWFERIVRRFSQDPHWALPYWNYSAPNGRQIPLPFRDPQSDLFVSDRRAAMNAGGTLPPNHVDHTQAFSFAGFANASTAIEGTPHSTVHVGVGGLMGSVLTAAQDPLFYLHHANIDRLWNLWLAQGGDRMDPIGDTTWTKHRFTFFNENGKPVQMTSCDVLRATEELHYLYEGELRQVKQYCLRKPVAQPKSFLEERLPVSPIPPVVLTAEPVMTSIDLKALNSQLRSLLESATDQIVLELQDVEAESSPDTAWDAYVGLPEGTSSDSKNSFFVGTVALFGTGIRSEAHHGFRPARFLFPIKRALAASLPDNAGQLPVQFVPQGVLPANKPLPPVVKSPVRIGRMNIMVERAPERSPSPQS